MTDVDIRARRAAQVALDDAQRDVDLDRGLAEVYERQSLGKPAASVVGTVEQSRRHRILAVAASIAVLAVVAALIAGLSLRDSPTTIVGEDPGPTAPADTTIASPTYTGVAPTTAPGGTVDPPDTVSTDATDPQTSSPGSADGVSTPFLMRDSPCAGVASCSLAADSDSTLVSFDATTTTLTVHSSPPRTLDLSAIGGLRGSGRLLLIGPDHVAYFSAPTAGAFDPVEDVIAVALEGPDAGSEIARALEAWGTDSELVRTPAGLVLIDCCGLQDRRPEAAAPTAVAWVDWTGAVIHDEGPELWVEFAAGEMTVVRRDGEGTQRWSVADVEIFDVRGMPELTALDDGGVLLVLRPVLSPDLARIVRARADGTVEEWTVSPAPPLFAVPDGSLVSWSNEPIDFIVPEPG